jgi:hypothetical protein
MDHVFLFTASVKPKSNPQSNPCFFRDVLVTHALIKNLISVRQLTTDNHVSVEFDPFGLSVKDYRTKAEIA